MKKNKIPVGRPRKEPTTVISVPVDCIPVVEKALGREIAGDQVAIVKIRIPDSIVDKIRKIISNNK